MQFAFTILEARKKVLYENAFDKVPKKLNFFEQETMSDQYITVPNSEEMVFVRVLEKFEDNQPHFIRPHIQVVLEQNNIYFLPFSGIRELLRTGKVELI